MRRMFAMGMSYCPFLVVLKCRFEIRVRTVFDNYPGTLSWGKATQISKALLGNKYLNIVFGMIDVRYHGHNAGNMTVLGMRRRHEY